MSDLNSKLNAVVLVGIVIVLYMVLLQPQQTAPPDDRWFQAAVVDQPGLVVVKFGAQWCGPCRMLDRELTGLASCLSGRASVVRIDVAQHRDLARHYGVSSIPRLMVFYHGQVLADRVGYADHNQLCAWVTALRTP
jgi:thioredoxin-like negative regulator of GroEL